MELLESDLRFVTKPSQDYFCPVCTEVLTDPYLSDCGHHLCGSCRGRLLAGNKAECPECREPDLLKSARLNKHLQRQVKDLVVYCSHHEEGCKWKGELRNLQEHLDPVKKRCDYVRIPCSFQCGELVRSGAVKEHKRSHCRKRPYTCKYCGYHNALDVVTERHMPACRQFPVNCPNNCETSRGLKRHQLQFHIKQCPLEIVPCSFSSIGCTARLPRKEMEGHEEQALRQHVALVLKAIEPKQEETATIVTPPPLDTLYLVNLPPVKFTIMEYVERKLAGEEWVSPPFYSHPQGYKMCLEVASTNDQENMSVYVHILQGEYDDDLIWPFEGRVSVELVNWKEDKGHHEKNFDINILTTRDYSLLHMSKNDSKSIAGKPHFIPHSSLSYDPASNTEYLHDDCLCVRVKSVDVYSTHLVHKTPVWQDPPASSMPPPLCEFTLAEFSKRKQFDNRFYSPSFYAHPHEMCIVVDANGIRNASKGSHMSVFVAPITKNNSPTLQPFECEVVVELLNWREDKEHFIRTLSLNSDHLFFYDNTLGTSLVRRRFIQHYLLSFNPTSNTEYLQDDCLRMRVKSVEFYSPTCSSSKQSSPFPDITLTEFSKRKQFGNIFFSSPFFSTSHPQGYKLYLRFCTNDSEKTHSSVHVFLMRGEYDHHLHWPCDCSVGVELINWREDKGHMLKWINVVSPQVIDSHAADSGSGYSQFVSHASLAFDPATNTEYLHDDCLRVRVVGVEVYSTDLLLKTPSWQNSSAPSESVCEFTLTKFSNRKALNNEFCSTPFYTHQEGYKLRLKVYANGNISGAGTHISVYVCIMKGEYDNQLQWPFEGKIKVNMLNWREARGHISKFVSFNRARTGDAACVEDIEFKEWGERQFCAHSSLAYDPSTNTEYLQDDCLRIQVPSVEVYSTALLLKTPAWQDPLTYTKPLLEFTLTEFSKRKQSAADNEYYSPAFYTHEQGYKICINVRANGNASGKGSHISVFVYHMKGEHDDQLHWPFQGDIVLEILNWQEDKGHYKKIIESNDVNRLYTNQVTETNMASTGWGSQQYIPHTALIYDPTNTEYVDDDCLRLRVSAVNVYSGPLMLKTPAWQGSPATTKLLLECTLTELTKRKEFGSKSLFSTSFYSHTQGYKLVLMVVLNVEKIIICALLLEGNHDEELEWPAKFNFTIELLNWRENKKHHKAIATGPTNKTYYELIQGSGLSIPYSSLQYDPLNNTEYLQDDCLRLRVLNNN